MTVVSLYLPSGEAGTERQHEKERFMAEFLPHLVTLRANAAADGREVVVCGDGKIAHMALACMNAARSAGLAG